MTCLDTCYYVGIGALLLVMLLFNVRCPFLQNGFHSLLRYDLRVDMFVNDNEGEPADSSGRWSAPLRARPNESSESEVADDEATTSSKRDRSKSFAVPRPEDSSDDDLGRRGAGHGPGQGGASRRSNVDGRKSCLRRRKNIIFRRCDLDREEELPSSCFQLISNNLVELVNSESFLAQCDSVALMDDVLRLEKSLECDKIVEDMST